MAQTNDNGQQSSSLSDFSFDDSVEFFGIKPDSSNDLDDTIREVKNEKLSSTATPKTTKIEDGEDDEEDDDDKVTFFEEETVKEKPKAKKETTNEPEEVDEEEEEEEEEVVNKDKSKTEDKKEEDGDEDTFFTTLTSELKEKGVFQNIELKEGEEITEEKFFELQDQEIELRVQETIEALTEGFDDEAKAFFKFKQNGGKSSDFLSAVVSPIDLDNFDESDPKQVSVALAHYLTEFEGLEGEDLADRLEWLKDGGKEKTHAVKYVAKMKKEREATIAKITKAQEDAAAARELKAKQFTAELKEVLNSTEAVGSFPITKEDQKNLDTYINKATVKVGKNKYVPKLQADLSTILKAETKEAKQKLIALAKILNTDFDVKDLAKETTTKVTKKVKSKLQDAKGSKVRSSSNSTKKALTDFF